MPTLDSRIDAYIAASPEFARPILSHLREVIHSACPDVEETMKWSRPHFQYKGMLCQMSAFTAHCALGFWKGAILFPASAEKESMGHFGRITALKDLPSKKALSGIVRQAMKLNDEGIKTAAKPKATPRELIVPDDLAKSLQADKAAQKVFDAGSPSFRREYVAWIEEAKTRNWKYEKC